MASSNTYLQLRGKTWYARVIIPPSIRKAFGGLTHLRASLKTTDIREANIRKHAIVSEMKQKIAMAKNGISYQDWRAALKSADSDDEKESVEYLIADWAESMVSKVGEREAILLAKKALDTNETLSELIDLFFSSQSFSIDSHRKHSRALKDLSDFFPSDPSLKSITPKELLLFTDNLLAGAIAPNTKRDRLSSLGHFWDWLERRFHVDKGSNPFRGITVKGGTVEDSRAFNDSEINLILTSEFKETWQKDAFIILLLTGARPNEILGLRQKHLDVESQSFKISISKTQAGIRTLPYRHEILVEIFQRLKNLNPNDPEARLFPVDHNTEKPAKNYINYFSRHKNKLQLPSEVSLYSTRKTFISKALDLGLDVVNIERYVGHKNSRLALSTYSKGRSDAGLIEIAEAIGKCWVL